MGRLEISEISHFDKDVDRIEGVERLVPACSNQPLSMCSMSAAYNGVKGGSKCVLKKSSN